MALLGPFWKQQEQLHGEFWTNQWLAEIGLPPLHQLTPAQLEQVSRQTQAEIVRLEAKLAAGRKVDGKK